MDKDIKTKTNDILSANGKLELSMDDLDMVTGGYIQQLMKAYVEASLAGKNEEAQKYQQLIFEFNKKMEEKYG